MEQVRDRKLDIHLLQCQKETEQVSINQENLHSHLLITQVHLLTSSSFVYTSALQIPVQYFLQDGVNWAICYATPNYCLLHLHFFHYIINMRRVHSKKWAYKKVTLDLKLHSSYNTFQLPTPLYSTLKSFHKHGNALHCMVCGDGSNQQNQRRSTL